MSHAPARLTLGDHARNTFLAGLIGVPVIGPSLEKLCFGALDELRMRRIEATLAEVSESMEREGKSHRIDDNEEFAALQESVTPGPSRATSEQKRVAFRNLLLNVMQLPPGDPGWIDVEVVIRLLDQVNEVGHSFLASFYLIKMDAPKSTISVDFKDDVQTAKYHDHQRVRPPLWLGRPPRRPAEGQGDPHPRRPARIAAPTGRDGELRGQSGRGAGARRMAGGGLMSRMRRGGRGLAPVAGWSRDGPLRSVRG